jgi:spermidine/putrescine transport system substrate-binding protein
MGSRSTDTARGALAVLTAMAALCGTSTAAAPRISYFTWGGYDEPAFDAQYAAQYGGRPRFSFYSSTDEGFTKLAAGYKADVAHPCIHDVRKWKDAGLLQPIDAARVTSWNDLLPALRDAPALKIDGKQWLVPWEWGFSSVLYRSDKVKPVQQSYEVMIDPRYKGRTSFPDAFDEIYQLAAILAKVAAPLALQEGDYPKIEAKFRALRDNARFIWTDPSQLEQALASGEIDVALGWPNSFKHLTKQGVPVGFMLNPKEKVITWLCGIAHLKAATAPPQEVYDFINALESPQAGKAMVEKFGFGPANGAALKIIAKGDLDAVGLGGDPGETLAHGNLLGPMPESQRKRLIDLWESIKEGG